MSKNSDLCGECRHFLNTEGRPPEDEHIIHRLLKQWRIIHGMPITWYFAPGEELDRRWRGYHAELALVPRVGPLRAHPWHGAEEGYFDDARGKWISMPTAVLRIRLWRVGQPGFMQLWWDPEARGARCTLWDIEPNAATADLVASAKLAVSYAFGGAGPAKAKPGPVRVAEGDADWFRQRAELLSKIATAKPDIMARNGRVNFNTLAKTVCYDERTLRRKCNQFG